MGLQLVRSQQNSDGFAWNVGFFADLVAKLAESPELGGSVLDSSALVFLPEGGVGPPTGGLGGFGPHSTDNMLALVAGHAGGLAALQQAVLHHNQGRLAQAEALRSAWESFVSATGHGFVRHHIAALLTAHGMHSAWGTVAIRLAASDGDDGENGDAQRGQGRF